MRLNVPDKNEILKAAVRATDLESLKQWLVSLVDVIDDLPEGKADAPVPRYAVPATGGTGAASHPAAGHEWAHDYLAPNGASAA